MPILTYVANQSGLLIPVMLKNNVTDFRIHSIALIDTGASHTAIHESVVQDLELTPVGIIGVTTPNAIGQYLKYDIDIVFENEWDASENEVNRENAKIEAHKDRNM